MTQIQNPMQSFKARLKKLDSKLTKVTPYWWDKSLAKSPSASQQAIISMARHLNLDLRSVLDDDADLKFKDVSSCYRKAGNKAINDLSVATGLVCSASRSVERMVDKPYRNFSSASVIREEILSTGKKYVDLLSLAAYCWDHGVPVVYIENLPASKKMDAVVQEIDGRPVITITKKQKHESALLFLLAHEMGHIFSGHLDNGQAIIDESVGESLEIDQQESEANEFALHLLTGSSDTRFHSNGVRLTGEGLAHAVTIKSDETQIDPGHIALNWAYTTENWAVANKALNILYPNPDWQNQLKKFFLSNIDQFQVDEDELDYLFNLMQIEY